MSKANRRKREHVPAQKIAKLATLETGRFFVPAVFMLFLLALIFLFRDFVFSNKMLFGSDTLQAGVFFRTFLVEYVQEHGSIPQWDPYLFGGMPYIEAFHGDILYPPSLLFFRFVGDLNRLLGWGLFWHIFIAGVTMYFCARQFRLLKPAALFSAASYMFAGYLISLVAPGHDGKIFVTALFPLSILFLDRAFERRPYLNCSLLGVVIGFIVLTPHPQMSYFVLWTLGLYTAYRLAMMIFKRAPLLNIVGNASYAAYAVVIGLGLSAIQFYPGYRYTNEFSPRADTKQGWEWATSWSLHEEEAFSLLIPEFAGTSSSKTQTVYWGKNAFKDNSESAGIVALFLAVIGIIYSRRRERWFFGGLALFALSYALAATTPLFKLYFYLIPNVSSLRAASMIMFIFSFSTALLAGFGLERIMIAVKERKSLGPRFSYLLWGVPSGMLLLALLFSAAGKGMIDSWVGLFYSEAPSLFVQQGVSKLDLAYANLPAIQTGAWFAFLFTALAAVCIWTYRERKLASMATMALLLLIALPVIDGVRFSSRFVDVVDSQRELKPTPVINYLTRQPGKFRVLDLRSRRSAQSVNLPLHGIEIPVGYHGNQLRWYDDLLGSIALKNLYNMRFLNLVGVRYLIFPTQQEPPANFLGPKPLQMAITLGPNKILLNDNALPRVFLADRYEVVQSRFDIYPKVLDGNEELRQLVYLEEEPSLSILPDSASSYSDSAWVIRHEPEEILIGVGCKSNKLLVLTDTWYDAWQVTIDGRAANCLRSYGAFRAVAIPAGSKEVQFSYDSPRYATGQLVTTTTATYLVILFVAFGFIAHRKRRRGIAADSESS